MEKTKTPARRQVPVLTKQVISASLKKFNYCISFRIKILYTRDFFNLKKMKIVLFWQFPVLTKQVISASLKKNVGLTVFLFKDFFYILT